MTQAQNHPSQPARYWRTFRRKLGEAVDLGGKALLATAATATFATLATNGALIFPNLSVGFIYLAGSTLLLLGIHLQAQAKPDA